MFKTGALGLGYYNDSVPEKVCVELHDAMWSEVKLEPVELQLDELVTSTMRVGDLSKATFEDELDAERGKPKRRKKKE